MDIHRPGGGPGIRLPGQLQQLLATMGAARVGDEDLQQPELPGGQVEEPPGPPGLQPGEVEAEGAGEEHGRAVQGAGAPQDGLHPGDELEHREGLHHVVVRAEAEALQAIRLLAPRREHQDRDLVLALAKNPQDFEAVHLGQHEVQHDQVRPVRGVLGQRRHPVPHRVHGEAFEAEVVGEELAEGGLVLHHKDVGHGISLKERVDILQDACLVLSWQGKMAAIYQDPPVAGISRVATKPSLGAEAKVRPQPRGPLRDRKPKAQREREHAT